MNTEIEAKFLHINHDEIRKKLEAEGGVCLKPMRLMRRVIIDYSDRRLQTAVNNAYIRVRDEGDRVTLTYKVFNSLSISGAQEIETVVDSFENTVAIFTAIGLEVVSLQESKREVWSIGAGEVMLDEWPWLDPYIEIEAGEEEEVRTIAEKLGLHWNNAVFGDVMVAYRNQYPYLTEKQTVGALPQVRFSMSFPDALKEHRD